MIGRGGPSLDDARGRQPRIVARRKKRMRPGALFNGVACRRHRRHSSAEKTTDPPWADVD